MNKLKALIVDDEPLAHEIIVDYLADLPFVEVVSQCYLATEALNYISENQVDLLFLDVNMPKLSGIELLKVLTHKPQVIITSAHQEYALESFELEVCDYLLKPYRYERFLKAVNKGRQQYQLQLESEQNNKVIEEGVKETSIFLKVDRKVIQLKLSDVVYFEAYGNYVKVWVGTKVYLTPRTLSSFESELVSDDNKFIRIHKSYIIQKTHIKMIENRKVEMSNEQLLPVGKNYKLLAKKLMDE